MNALSYDDWLFAVEKALRSLNMPMEDWQRAWEFNFAAEHQAGTSPIEAAEKANRYWWYRQNKAIGQDCLLTPRCWLPRKHSGDCVVVSND